MQGTVCIIKYTILFKFLEFLAAIWSFHIFLSWCECGNIWWAMRTGHVHSTIDGTKVYKTEIGLRVITDEKEWWQKLQTCVRVNLSFCAWLSSTYPYASSHFLPLQIFPAHMMHHPTLYYLTTFFFYFYPCTYSSDLPLTFLSPLHHLTAALLQACRTEPASAGRLCADRLVLCRNCRCSRCTGCSQELCPVWASPWLRTTFAWGSFLGFRLGREKPWSEDRWLGSAC